jgi:hypothetical protein
MACGVKERYPYRVMKVHRGDGGVVPCIFIVGIMWRQWSDSCHGCFSARETVFGTC